MQPSQLPPIRHEGSEHGGAFLMEQEGRQIGELHYQRAGARIIVTHTEVAYDMREKGLGQLLIDAAVEWARAENLKIVPLCSYARRVLADSPKYSDVL